MARPQPTVTGDPGAHKQATKMHAKTAPHNKQSTNGPHQ